uniref:Uncharacterized protein n=1 Tax=Arundo donax TaxID=35708 RepID=A0A0A9FQ83_ARUDO
MWNCYQRYSTNHQSGQPGGEEQGWWWQKSAQIKFREDSGDGIQ